MRIRDPYLYLIDTQIIINLKHVVFLAMNRENRSLVTDELVEIQDFRKIIDHSRGILENIPQINNKIFKSCQHVTS